jgi:hypothetical protein
MDQPQSVRQAHFLGQGSGAVTVKTTLNQVRLLVEVNKQAATLL